jgi:hypothetical protein
LHGTALQGHRQARADSPQGRQHELIEPGTEKLKRFKFEGETPQSVPRWAAVVFAGVPPLANGQPSFDITDPDGNPFRIVKAEESQVHQARPRRGGRALRRADPGRALCALRQDRREVGINKGSKKEALIAFLTAPPCDSTGQGGSGGGRGRGRARARDGRRRLSQAGRGSNVEAPLLLAIADKALREIGSSRPMTRAPIPRSIEVALEYLESIMAELAGVENLWFLQPARQTIDIPASVPILQPLRPARPPTCNSSPASVSSGRKTRPTRSTSR